MLDLILAALLAATPQGGTVHTADGGRLRGTILDASAAGVTVQLGDGSTRKLEPAQVSRVDFSDGTTWKPTPVPPAAPPAPPPAQTAVAPAAAGGAAVAAARPASTPIPLDKLDTVYLARGGRVRCLVMEEGPEGVVVRVSDGSERRYAPGQVSRIDWSDGTRSELGAPAQPAAPAPAAAPAAQPFAPPPAQPAPPQPVAAPPAPQQVAPGTAAR